MLHVYVGTYNKGEGDGIYILRLDPERGTLERQGSAPGENPSFLALHPTGRFLYAVAEIKGHVGGGCLAFAVEPEGALIPMNHMPTVANGPCHLSVDAAGQYVLVANYSGRSVAVLPLQEDGSLAEASDFVQHEGSSVHPQRQQQPHPHSIVPAPDGQHVVVPDLGLDRVLVYGLDHGRLTPAEPPWVEVAPGAGPRHFAFHPNGRFGYVINELDSTVTGFRFSGGSGQLEPLQTVSTLPDGFDGENYCAEIQVHPAGRFLYGSNRGHDSIAIFVLDPQTGRLTPHGHEPSRGGWPRNFTLAVDGSYLLAANQHDDNVVVFTIDAASGGLTLCHEVTGIPSPVCVRVSPPAS